MTKTQSPKDRESRQLEQARTEERRHARALGTGFVYAKRPMDEPNK